MTHAFQLDVFAYVGFPIIINTRVGVLTRTYVGDYLDLIYSKQQYRDAFIVCLLALSTGCILSLAVAETHRRAVCSTVKPIEPSGWVFLLLKMWGVSSNLSRQIVDSCLDMELKFC